MTDRPSTPPRASRRETLPQAPMTPEQVRRMEQARLRAKAAGATADRLNPPTTAFTQGQKRPYSSISTSTVPRTHRDASSNTPYKPSPASHMTQPKDDNLRPAKKFERTAYIEYDFSKMTDTKGGFLSATDDPHNRAMKGPAGRPGTEEEQKPAHMTAAEWERMQVIRKLRAARQGPFEPGISALEAADRGADGEEVGEGKGKCRECGSLEIDWKWEEVFGVGVCGRCKENEPEKYSLLTKTEAREDYLLTDPELRDEELFPRLERPNPHKQNWNNMQLFLRFQIEAYAFSARKWGSPAALDAEFERRQIISKERKEKKINAKFKDLKKRTRVEAYKRDRKSVV